VALSLALLACTDATYGAPDLPDDWAAATHIERLEQSDCSGFAVTSPSEELAASVADGTIEVSYKHARFRCQQDVEAFARSEGTTIDVLVQPINLNPPLVAKCECAYDLSIVLPAVKRGRLEPGSYEVRVSRRWDNINKPNPPVSIGTATAEVP
jgi:hypothetical protein